MENRLREFQEAAAASDSNLFSGSHQIGSGLGGGADDIEMGTISSQPDSNTRNLDPFLSIIEAIRERVERIKQAAASVELLHRVILASVGGEEASDAGKKISLIVKKVNEDAQFVRSALKTAYRETETAARTNGRFIQLLCRLKSPYINYFNTHWSLNSTS